MDLSPIVYVTTNKIQNSLPTKPLVALLDSGSSHTMVKQNSLPHGTIPNQSEPKRTTTTNGTFSTNSEVHLHQVKFPEFGNHCIDNIKADIFDSPSCRYDLIIGRDILKIMGIKIDFKGHVLTWMGRDLPMKSSSDFSPTKVDEVEQYFNHLRETEEDEDFDIFAELYADDVLIKDRKYQAVSPEEVVRQLDHLTVDQRQKLKTTFEKYKRVFDGTLGKHPTAKIDIELIPGAKPIYQSPYPVSFKRKALFQRELNNMIADGVFTRIGESEWGFPSFIIPKKDGRVRWLSDFRKLNKLIVRKPFPLPKIQDILQQRGKYTYFTKIDLSMMFYCFELSERSKRICVISTEENNYSYNRLPMGVKISPDVAQRFMVDMLQGIPNCCCYIDDLGIWTDGSFDDHLAVVDLVLSRLHANNMKCNPLKCEWFVKETDFLGFWMTPEGVKPWKKRIDSILQMDRPKNNSDVRAFIGAVNHYKSLWPRRAHVLAPLAELTGKGRFEWTPRHEKSFQEMKAIITADAMNTFPDYSIPFHIFTDASDFQLGAAITQHQKPIAYYSKKLTPAQKNYTTTEKELLAIVMTLTTYRKMLMGSKLHVYTDHKNLTFKTFSVQRILRWRLFVDQFDCDIHYIPGHRNVLADCFSRLPQMEKPSAGVKELQGKGKLIDFNSIKLPQDNEEIIDGETFLNIAQQIVTGCTQATERSLDTNQNNETFYIELRECLLNLPPLDVMDNPITINNIVNHQSSDLSLLNKVITDSHDFRHEEIEGYEVVHFRTFDEGSEIWKIVIPPTLLPQLLKWYHLVLGHCGQQRLYQTVKARFHANNLQRKCNDTITNCPQKCQLNKQSNKNYGHLPPRAAGLFPWETVAVDLIGPWKVKVNNVEMQFMALTCIDPVSNVVEAIRLRNKTSEHVAEQFANCWLSRYPRPIKCIHDNGGEFLGWNFQELLTRAGIRSKPTTIKNPQANAVCERMHKTVADILRSIIKEDPPRRRADVEQKIDNALSTCVHALRCAINHTMKTSPGAMVFNRDMLMNVQLLVDLESIRGRRQQKIDDNTKRNNNKRIDHNYQIGDLVKLKVYDPTKLEERFKGPYRIDQVFTNGTVSMQTKPGIGTRINIRKIEPYRGRL